MVQIEAPGINRIEVNIRYEASAPGCWAIEVSGVKERNDGLAALKEAKELEGNERLLPADEQYTDKEVEPSEDTCRYGKFHEIFQINMMFNKYRMSKLGPIKGIFYLVFEEEEEEEVEEF